MVNKLNTRKGYRRVILSVDVGGTNTNFSIVGFKDDTPEIILLKLEYTNSADKFFDLINRFLDYAKKEYNIEPKEACFAVAGIIENTKNRQRVNMTHSHHVIDSEEIIKKTPLKYVLLVNDFEAISYAINVLRKKDFITLNKGKPVKKGVIATVGAGTGFGKSILYFDYSANAYKPLPSEGGQSDFPILDEAELQLAEFIKKIRGIRNQIRYEDVLSGKGLKNIYQFLQTNRYQDLPKELSAEEISKTKKTNPCSKETFEWFIKFYARCCRNFVLDTLATGGLYIAGGIAAKNADSFSKNFLKDFVKNETFHEILKNIPIHIITNYDISPIGAAFALKVRK